MVTFSSCCRRMSDLMRTLRVVGTGSEQGNCYILNCDGDKLIIDAGVKIDEIKKALNWSLKDVSACIVSHEHGDHTRSVKDLRKLGVRVFTPYEDPADQMSVRFGRYLIDTFKLPHNGTQNRGFLIRNRAFTMLYITDFEFCGFRFQHIRPNVILIECNHNRADDEAANYAHVVLGHASLDVTREFVRVNATEDLTNVILCHLSDSNADSGLILSDITSVVPLMTQVDIAEKGMVIEL